MPKSRGGSWAVGTLFEVSKRQCAPPPSREAGSSPDHDYPTCQKVPEATLMDIFDLYTHFYFSLTLFRLILMGHQQSTDD